MNLAFTPGIGELPSVRTFRATFHAEDPSLVILVCPESGRTRMQELLLDDPAFVERWTLTARGPHFSGRAQVCVYTNSAFVVAQPEVGVARYERLDLDLPGLYDWASLRSALLSGAADDPATAWGVGLDGEPLQVPETRPRRGGKKGAPGLGVFNAPGTGEAERIRRRRARGLDP